MVKNGYPKEISMKPVFTANSKILWMENVEGFLIVGCEKEIYVLNKEFQPIKVIFPKITTNLNIGTVVE